MVTQDFKDKLAELGFDRILIEVSDYVADTIGDKVKLNLTDEKEFLLFHAMVYAVNHKVFWCSEAIYSVDSRLNAITKEDVYTLFPEIKYDRFFTTYWTLLISMIKMNTKLIYSIYSNYALDESEDKVTKLESAITDFISEALNGSTAGELESELEKAIVDILHKDLHSATAGSNRLVESLNELSFEIANKPYSKVTDETNEF